MLTDEFYPPLDSATEVRKKEKYRLGSLGSPAI